MADLDPVKQAVHMGNPEVITQLIEGLIDYHSARHF